MSNLHKRVAKALGWSVADAQALSMASLRELVRPVDPDLAREMDYMIQSGAYVRGLPGPQERWTKIWIREGSRPWELWHSSVRLDKVTRFLEMYRRDHPDAVFVASQTKPQEKRRHAEVKTDRPKKIAKDIEAAVRAAQLYIGKGLTMRIADEQKLYNSMNRKIASVAKRRGMDEAGAYQQIMAEAKRRGGLQATPGKDI